MRFEVIQIEENQCLPNSADYDEVRIHEHLAKNLQCGEWECCFRKHKPFIRRSAVAICL